MYIKIRLDQETSGLQPRTGASSSCSLELEDLGLMSSDSQKNCQEQSEWKTKGKAGAYALLSDRLLVLSSPAASIAPL